MMPAGARIRAQGLPLSDGVIGAHLVSEVPEKRLALDHIHRYASAIAVARGDVGARMW